MLGLMPPRHIPTLPLCRHSKWSTSLDKLTRSNTIGGRLRRMRASFSLLAFHCLDQLLQTEGFWQEAKILSIGQVLGESILGIA